MNVFSFINNEELIIKVFEPCPRHLILIQNIRLIYLYVSEIISRVKIF